MTPTMRRLLALVALNGRAMDLHREFADSGDAELAALMRQIGVQTTVALGLMLKRRAALVKAAVPKEPRVRGQRGVI